MRFRFVFFAILFFCSSSFSQTAAQYIFTRYSQADGLGSGFIHQITEDNKGFIWLPAEEGLSRFDGYSFKTYYHDPADSTSLPNNVVSSCVFDEHQNMIVLTASGVCKYNPKQDNFITLIKFDERTEVCDQLPGSENEVWLVTDYSLIKLNAANGEYVTYNFPKGYDVVQKASASLQLAADKVWISTYTWLLCFDEETNQFSEPRFLDFDVESLIDIAHAPKSIISRSNEFYLYNTKGFFHFNETDQTFQLIAANSMFEQYGLKPYRVFYVHEDYALYLASYGQFVKLFFDDGHQEKINLHFADGTPLDRIDRSMHVTSDESGDIWICTNQSGLYCFKPKQNIVEHFGNVPQNTNSISSNTVPWVFIDNSGVIWISCRGQGLVKLEIIPALFKPFAPSNEGYGNSITDYMNVRTIGELDNNHLLIGTLADLLVFSKTDSSFSEFVTPLFDGRSKSFGALLKDSKDRLWIGHWGNGLLSVLDQKNNKVAEISFLSFGESSEDCRIIRDICEDNNGQIWIATTCGVFEINPDEINYDDPQSTLVKFYSHGEDENSLSALTVYALVTDSKNQIWAGTESGLNVIDPVSGKVKKYLHDKNDPQSLRVDNVRSLLIDHNGIIWAGTNGGGLNRFNANDESFTAFTMKNGLPNDAIYAIQEDEKGFLWLSTNKGLCRFDPATNTCRNYSLTDGLQNLEFNTNASHKTSSGELVFGGVTGFNFFNPSVIDKQNKSQTLIITSVKVFDHDVPIDTNGIELSYDQNFLSFEFSTLSHYRLQDNQYSYMLEGVDEDWIFSGNRHFASYPDLSPGRYVLRVRVSNSMSSESSETSLEIFIHPPWYKTTLAIIAFIFSGIILIIIIYRTQRARLLRNEREASRIREAELKSEALEEKNRSAQLELDKAHELEISFNKLKATQEQLIQQEKLASLGQMTAGIAHEIQNPLNFVNNFSEVSNDLIEEFAKAKTEEEKKEIFEELKNSLVKINHHGNRASTIVKSMLAHSRTSKGEKQPTDINLMCEEFLNLAYHGMRARHSGLQVEMIKKFDDSIPKINLVQQDVSRVLLNIFNNALFAIKNKEAGKIIVSTEKMDNKIVIRIKDNGGGIPENIKQKIFDPFFTTKATGEGTGLGLSISYEIIKAQGGDLQFISEERIGTEFIVELPVK